MNLLTLSITAILCSSALADELDTILKDIDSKDFKVRENARTALSNYVRPASKEKIQHLVKKYTESPSPEVRSSIKQLAMLHLFGKGFLGVEHQGYYFSLNGKNLVGIRISRVSPNRPAAKAGLGSGDIIYEIAGKGFNAPDKKKITSSTQRMIMIQDAFSQAIKSYKQGETIDISYARNGKALKTKVTLASYNQYLSETGGPEVDANGFTKDEYQQFKVMWKKLHK